MTLCVDNTTLLTMAINIESFFPGILNEQEDNGFFPTYRNQYSNEGISQLKKIDNIGLHTFVLEKLIEMAGDNPIIADSFQNGLEWITKDAIDY